MTGHIILIVLTLLVLALIVLGIVRLAGVRRRRRSAPLHPVTSSEGYQR